MSGGACAFGPFVVDRGTYTLKRGGEPVALTPKLLDLLLYLVERPATLVTKEELLDALWPDANVTDNALAQAVSELRQILGDDASAPTYIRTIPRRGYRFVAPVEAHEDAPAQASPGSLRSNAGARETPSRDAYRAFVEGSLRLETLDVREMAAARDDFARAVSLDPRYALAYTGLASVELVLYEETRWLNEPARHLLDDALEHARHAVSLDTGLSEAHATLALLLVSARRTEEAVEAARRAVELEPTSWRHLFRLAYASWGQARLEAAARVRSLYPEFAFAHFQVAMVHVARGRLPAAESVLREGLAAQGRSQGGERYPAQGLHWLLGLVLLAQARPDEALEVFDTGLRALEPHRLYGREFIVHTQLGRGMALLRLDRVDEATVAFTEAMAPEPTHAPSRLGMACCLRARGESSRADAELRVAEEGLAVITRHGSTQAAQVRAELAVARGRLDEAVEILDAMVGTAPPGFAGWTLGVDPFLRQLQSHQGFARVLGHLSRRAE